MFNFDMKIYLKLFVIESPIFSILEKVCEPVAVLQSIVHIVGDALPVGNGFGVTLGNGRPLFGVESVVFITLKSKKFNVKVLPLCYLS